MKYHIKSTIETLQKVGILNFQASWEFLKCKIGKFSIEFSKLLTQNTKKRNKFLENKL